MKLFLKHKPDAMLDHDVAVQLAKVVLACETFEVILDDEDRADIAACRPMSFSIDYGEGDES